MPPNTSAPAAQPATPAQPPSSPGAFNTKVLEPRTLGIILGVSVLYALTRLVVFVSYALWIVAVIVVWQMVDKIKKSASDQPDNSERDKITVLMALSPVAAQAIFYYRLKKTKPNSAKIFNDFGWKVFGVELVLSIVAYVIVFLLVGNPK